MWHCGGPSTCVAPEGFHSAALLLTATSTSTEADDASVTMPSAPLLETQSPTAPTSVAPQHPVSTASVSSAVVVAPPLTTSDSGQATIESSPKSAVAALTPDDTIQAEVRSTDVPTASTAIATPALVSQNNAEGGEPISTSLFIATPTAFINTIISVTNVQGSLVSSTTNILAMVLTTTNAQGEQITTTAPVIASEASPNAIASARPALTVGDQIITADAENRYTIGSQTLSRGGIITASGIPISLAQGGTKAIVGGTTQILEPAIPQATPIAPVITIGTQIVTANTQGQYVVGSQTLIPGGAISVSGVPVSLASGGAYAVVGSNTETLGIATPPALTVGSQVLTVNSMGQYTADGQTLSPGGQITISGTTVSLASGGAYAVVGTSTEDLGITARPAFTIGSQTITANSLNEYIVSGQTLSPGGEITISGTTVSLGSDGAYAVVGTSTENLAITSPPAFTIGTQTITANSLNEYIVDGQTLLPGSVITVSGTPISLATDRTAVVIGTSTEGLASLIVGGLGRNGSATAAFTGGAGKTAKSLLIEGIFWVVGLMTVMVL